MSEQQARAGEEPTLDGSAAAGAQRKSAPAGVSELLRRLGEHRARSARHVLVERIAAGGMTAGMAASGV